MNSHEQVHAATDLRGLGKFFGRKLDDETITDYVEVLADLPYAQFELALQTCKRDGKFFPKPREIRMAASDARSETRPAWTPTQYVTGLDGEVTPVYHCRWCEDSGFRPACGCALSHLGTFATVGECPTHPLVVHQLTYRQALMVCDCRGSNPSYLAKLQRPQAPRVDRA